MGLEVARETAQAFFEDGDVDAADELVSVVDIENQDAGTLGSAFLLSPVGGTDVEVTFGSRLAVDESGEEQDNREQHG